MKQYTDLDMMGNKILNSPSIQPPAPKKYKLEIKNPGSGYSVGDVIKTSDPDVFVVIRSINTADGSILSVEVDPQKVSESTTGVDGSIQAKPQMQVGWNGSWEDLPTSNSSGSSEIDEDIVSNLSVGGISDNQLIQSGTSITDFVKKLLTKEISPTIKITATKSGLNLKGTTVSSPTITLSITSKGTSIINSIEFLRDGVRSDLQNYVDGTDTYTFTEQDVTTNTNLSAKVVFTESDGVTKGSVTASVDYIFVNYSYFGVCDNIPTESDIQTMTPNLKNSKAYTSPLTDVTNQRTVYAYPKSLGQLSSIKDSNNFEYLTGSYTQVEMTINNETYLVYYLTDPMTALRFKQIYS